MRHASCTLGNQLNKNENREIKVKHWRLKDVLMQAMIASLYAVLVYALPFMSSGMIQFRIAEVLMILVLFDRRNLIGVTLGCFVANLVTGAILIDVLVGPLATLIAGIFMILTKKKPWIAMIWPAIFNGIIIGLILTYAYLVGTLFLNMAFVFIGEFAVLYLLGLPIYVILKRNAYIREMFGN